MDLQEKSSWSELLRQERIRRNWRQREVAEQLGTTTVTVTRWERGSHLPSAYFRVKLCALFGKSAEELGFIQVQENTSDISDKCLEAQPANLQLVDAADITFPSLIHTLQEEPSVNLLDIPTHAEPPPHNGSQRLWPRRKILLLGAGALGLVTATTAGLWFASHNSAAKQPVTSKSLHLLPVPLSQRSHHLFDADTLNWANHLAWSSDGRYLAAATGSNMLVLWHIEQEVIAIAYSTLNKWVNDVSWSKTNWIAAATAETSAGSLQLWKFPEQTPAITMKKDYALRSVCWSPDDTYLAISGHTPTVEVWRPFPYRLISRYTDATLGLLGISRVKWSPSGRLLACATDDGTVHVWEALTGKARVIYRGHKSRVHDLAWSPDERALISCSTDQTCQVWDASNGHALMVYRGHKGVIEGVDWSPNGSWVASASADRTVHIWTPFTGQLIAVYDKYRSTVETAHWSADGSMLAIGTDADGVEVWPGRY